MGALAYPDAADVATAVVLHGVASQPKVAA